MGIDISCPVLTLPVLSTLSSIATICILDAALWEKVREKYKPPSAIAALRGEMVVVKGREGTMLFQ